MILIYNQSNLIYFNGMNFVYSIRSSQYFASWLIWFELWMIILGKLGGRSVTTECRMRMTQRNRQQLFLFFSFIVYVSKEMLLPKVHFNTTESETAFYLFTFVTQRNERISFLFCWIQIKKLWFCTHVPLKNNIDAVLSGSPGVSSPHRMKKCDHLIMPPSSAHSVHCMTLTLMLLEAYLANAKWCKSTWEMTETLANGYSSENTRWELSNEYQQDRV